MAANIMREDEALARKKSSYKLRYRQVPGILVLGMIALVVLVFGLINIRLNRGIEALKGQVEEGSLVVAAKQKELSELSSKLQLASTDAFIATEARTRYGYLAPGEIRFVVVNPELLWGEEGPPMNFGQ